MSNILYIVKSSFGEWEDHRVSISGVFTDILFAEQYKEELDNRFNTIKEAGEPDELTAEMLLSMTQQQIEEWEQCWDNYHKADEYNNSYIETIELNTKLL